MNDAQLPKLAAALTEHHRVFGPLLTVAQAQAIISNPCSFIETACAAWKKNFESVPSIAAQCDEWSRFYREVFIFTSTEALNLSLPSYVNGFNWLVVVRKGLTLNKVLEAMRTEFKVYSHIGDGLDKNVPTNDRVPDKNYAIKIRDRVEADEENKNLSANKIKEKKILSMTLLERLLLELFHFWKTGEHLDTKNVTLCSGSRYSGDGGVPGVGWDRDIDAVDIRWCNADGPYDGLRARTVVVG